MQPKRLAGSTAGFSRCQGSLISKPDQPKAVKDSHQGYWSLAGHRSLQLTTESPNTVHMQHLTRALSLYLGGVGTQQRHHTHFTDEEVEIYEWCVQTPRSVTSGLVFETLSTCVSVL